MQSLDAHIDREFIAFTAIAGLVAEDTCNDRLTTDHSPRATATALPRSTGPSPTTVQVETLSLQWSRAAVERWQNNGVLA